MAAKNNQQASKAKKIKYRKNMAYGSVSGMKKHHHGMAYQRCVAAAKKAA